MKALFKVDEQGIQADKARFDIRQTANQPAGYLVFSTKQAG
jgi:hypothetical protein